MSRLQHRGDLIFPVKLGVILIFISPNEHQKLYVHEWLRGFATHENRALGVHSVGKKSILHRKNQFSVSFMLKCGEKK